MQPYFDGFVSGENTLKTRSLAHSDSGTRARNSKCRSSHTRLNLTEPIADSPLTLTAAGQMAKPRGRRVLRRPDLGG